MEINLKHNIAELERELSRQKDRDNHPDSQYSEVSKFVANQEVENHKAISLVLNKMVIRLEEDCKSLRKRELSDRETIKGLMEKLEKNDRDFKGKLLEMELGKKKLEDEALQWKNKLEARVSKIVGERKERELKEKLVKLAEENRDLKARALKVSEENCSSKVKRNVEEKTHCNENERVHTSEVDEENEIPLRSFTKKRSLAEAWEGDKKDSHSLRRSSVPAKRRAHGISQGAIKVEEVREEVCRNFQVF
ncbi:uncharacterized protein A4U43_C06F13310 [Asparagus officinalis]|uniref:Uncharacterized protein n=1 Tax=Asparagus officinalis TaxID=4686 RepID=A0A5P1EM90_ASPOF|nr:uncharacterized protein A4U43_C06F13310 [Asparagus officinalis]